MRSPGGSGSAACRQIHWSYARSRVSRGYGLRRVLDLVRAPRIHVEPTPCEREPASGLGDLVPTVRTAPTWLVQVHMDAARPARSEHGEGSFGSPHDFPAVPWPACRSCTATPHAAPTGRPSGCAWTGGRIVDADAPGIDTDLRGLTLLEACAVGGETLPVDALANALAPAVRATPDPDARCGRDERRRRQRGHAPARPGPPRSA